MKTVKLGNTDIEISPVGLGCMGFTHAYGKPIEKQEAVKIIRKAYDLGYTFFDTAQRYTGVYPDGTIAYNEEVVGEALKDIRHKVVIATKCGITMIDGKRTLDARPETIKRTLNESLKRLQTDYVDLYYLHSIDPNTQIETVAKTMKELYLEGKIKAWGISQVDEETLRRAHKVFPVSAIQNRYSMMARDEEKIFDTCKELGVTFVAFSPMANGFLTGTYHGEKIKEDQSDFRNLMPQFTKDGYEESKELLSTTCVLNFATNISAVSSSTAPTSCTGVCGCSSSFTSLPQPVTTNIITPITKHNNVFFINSSNSY